MNYLILITAFAVLFGFNTIVFAGSSKVVHREKTVIDSADRAARIDQLAKTVAKLKKELDSLKNVQEQKYIIVPDTSKTKMPIAKPSETDGKMIIKPK